MLKFSDLKKILSFATVVLVASALLALAPTQASDSRFSAPPPYPTDEFVMLETEIICENMELLQVGIDGVKKFISSGGRNFRPIYKAYEQEGCSIGGDVTFVSEVEEEIFTIFIIGTSENREYVFKVFEVQRMGGEEAYTIIGRVVIAP